MSLSTGVHGVDKANKNIKSDWKIKFNSNFAS